MSYTWQPENSDLTVKQKVGIGIETPSQELEVIGDISATNLNLSGNANAAQLFGDGSNLTGLVTTTGNSTIDGSLTINQNLTVSGNFQLGTLAINEFSSDGNLADNSNLAIPTEQAVKTYVDSQINTRAALNGDKDKDFAADNLKVSGDLEVQGNLFLGNKDDDVITITGVVSSGHSSGALQVNSGLRTNGSVSVDGNLSVSNAIIASGNFQLGTLSINEFSSDGNLTNNSDLAIPTEQAVKTYVDNQITLVNNALDTKASLNGASDEDFTVQNLTVGDNVGIGTTTPEAKLDIIPSGSQPWLKMGNGGDNGRLWVEYGSNSAPLLVLSDLDDRPRIRFQQMGTQTEADPEFQSWIGLAQGLSSDLAIIGGNVGIGTTNPSQKLEVSGNVKISGDFQFSNSDGGFAKLTPHKYNNESSFKKNNVKLSLGSRGTLAPIGQPPLEYEFAIGHTFTGLIADPIIGIRSYTNFVKKFSVNQDGDAYFAGSKGGYVVDYFVNRVDDTLEQGDVVIISEHQVSHYSGSQNNIPIPEVDLTDIPYNSCVCGIVAKVTTDKDLPYVEVESQTQPEMQPEEIEKLEVSDIEILHPLKALAAESKEELDITKISDRHMGTMVTLGAFAHCKVDADIAPIQVGDLLTTSSTKGHAQKVLEPERAIGAIIGKALRSLNSGKGKIPVLVMLQ